MLLPLLLTVLGAVHGSAPATPPPNNASFSASPSGAGHYDLTDKHKALIDRLTKPEKPPEVVLEVVDGKLTAKSNDFTQEELEMLVFLLSEL